jgi:hypothetical protein
MENLKARQLHPHPHMLVMRHFARFGNKLLVASSFNCATLLISTHGMLCIGNPPWQTSNRTKSSNILGRFS